MVFSSLSRFLAAISVYSDLISVDDSSFRTLGPPLEIATPFHSRDGTVEFFLAARFLFLAFGSVCSSDLRAIGFTGAHSTRGFAFEIATKRCRVKPRHEEFKLNIVKVLAATTALVLLLVFLSVVLREWQKSFPPATPLELVHPSPQSPRQQIEFESGALLKNLKGQQQQELQQYRWTDPEHRFAQVPVDRAMEALAAKISREKKP